MEYLFFNGLESRGRKFQYLVNKYAIFDNLDKEQNKLIGFLVSQPDHPYKDSAYFSDIARKNLDLFRHDPPHAQQPDDAFVSLGS